MNSTLNRCVYLIPLSHAHVLSSCVRSLLKNACLCIQDNMAISCGSRAHLEEESVAQVIVFWPLCARLLWTAAISLLINHCDISATAINVSYISHVRLSLPGVVLLCERDQGHTVWLQAFHTWGCTQDLLFSTCRAMVRPNTPVLYHILSSHVKVNITITYRNKNKWICHCTRFFKDKVTDENKQTKRYKNI